MNNQAVRAIEKSLLAHDYDKAASKIWEALRLGEDFWDFCDPVVADLHQDFVIAPLRDIAQRKKGFVYLALHTHMSNVYKVGMTQKTPGERMVSLVTAGVLGRWIEQHHYYSFDAMWVEHRAHEYLKSQGLQQDREIFLIPAYHQVEELMEFIQKAQAGAFHVLKKYPGMEDFAQQKFQATLV